MASEDIACVMCRGVRCLETKEDFFGKYGMQNVILISSRRPMSYENDGRVDRLQIKNEQYNIKGPAYSDVL